MTNRVGASIEAHDHELELHTGDHPVKSIVGVAANYTRCEVHIVNDVKIGRDSVETTSQSSNSVQIGPDCWHLKQPNGFAPINTQN